MTAKGLMEGLPAELVERVRVLDARPAARGDFVLYWLHSTMRAHENPALEAALAWGDALDSPVLVYQALSERHPYANDRHWRFALEGARELHRDLRARGVGAVFHLERPGHRGDVLRHLAQRASVLVTDDVPVEPLRSWTRALAAGIEAPVARVDTACVLPMSRVAKRFERAFAFRRATEKARAACLGQRLDERPVARPNFVPELPFAPFDLESDLEAAIASCEIDHAVAPVPHTRGGSSAGYARWRAFCDDGLARYARTRNDPLRDGTSRMSAYLHWGMVSPMRIAREAAAIGGPGAEKFLEELLIWRELAWNFCARTRDCDSSEALPAWARESLAAHARDARPALLDRETLARGRTGDALWDACAASLRVHGELHNNVRMTWGKAIAQWRDEPEDALRVAIELNHRYALDGRDPASYGGLLWCFGQFDRPFEPERDVLGVVRPRPTSQHAARLDVARYAARCERPAAAFAPRVAVIGAGLAGLSCARVLQDHGLDVRVYDKARGPGGRISSRRRALGGRELQWDLGCAAFEAADPRFVRVVEAWAERGLVAPWSPAAGEGREWVAVPRMSALARSFADELQLTTGFRVARIERRGARFYVHADGSDAPGEGPFDDVVVTAPGPQAIELCEDVAPRIADALRAAPYAPGMTWACSLPRALPDSVPGDIDVRGHEVFERVVRQRRKPGRSDDEILVANVRAGFAEERFERDPGETRALLREALAALLRVEIPQDAPDDLHRWRYARTTRPLGEACLVEAERGVSYAGDACLGSRLEASWLSGTAAAGRLLGRLAERDAPSRQGALFGDA